MIRSSDIVISQLNGVVHMIFLGMTQNCLGAFCVSGGGFDLHQCTLSLISNHKIYFKSGILMKIIKLSSHFCKNISNQIFEESSLISVKISLQDIILCSILQHTDKKSGRLPSYLEAVEPFFTTEY